jgi:hypothetical protein
MVYRNAKNTLNFDEAAANLIVRMQKSAKWRLQATVVKLTYQLQSLYLPSFEIELGQRKIQSSSASYICIKQTQNEIHLQIRIFRGLSPLLLKGRGLRGSYGHEYNSQIANSSD